MLPAAASGPGMNMGFPDVCLTPAAPVPIPVPYPNIAEHAMAVGFCPTIMVQMLPAHNVATIHVLTQGDDGGVANPVFMQMGTYTLGSVVTFLEGMPGTTMASMTTGNDMNNPVGVVTVPDAPTIMYCYAAPADAVATLAEGAVQAFLEAGTGSIAIRVFSSSVPAAVHCAIRELEARGLERLVIDLRDNPGGEILAAIEVLRDLLPDGSVIATLQDLEGDDVVYYARGDAYPWPLVVRVNGRTGSAAEVFAGSLKAHGRALVVGATTYGKGTAKMLWNGAFVDAARVRLPGDVEIDGAGIQPDLAEMPEGWRSSSVG